MAGHGQRTISRLECSSLLLKLSGVPVAFSPYVANARVRFYLRQVQKSVQFLRCTTTNQTFNVCTTNYGMDSLQVRASIRGISSKFLLNRHKTRRIASPRYRDITKQFLSDFRHLHDPSASGILHHYYVEQDVEQEVELLFKMVRSRFRIFVLQRSHGHHIYSRGLDFGDVEIPRTRPETCPGIQPCRRDSRSWWVCPTRGFCWMLRMLVRNFYRHELCGSL